ncbi:MAG: Trk system potassium transporter TrkA [Alphaproteobacteria bacterium]
MKIIIAGAGLTGSSIVSYLSQNYNSDDIVVIDTNPCALQKLSASYDVQTICGSSSNPEILKQAGTKDADIIMALTDSDEVNMVTCQMAYSLFNIQKKIARVEETDLLAPLWKDLYNEQNMPIDYIVSTNLELANNVFSLIKIPQARDFACIRDGRFNLLSFKIEDTTPIVNAQILELERLFNGINISVLLIIRNGCVVIPTEEETFLSGDEVFFITSENAQDIAIEAFGKASQSNERVLIFGANNVCELLLKQLQKDSVITNIKVIEENIAKAQDLSFRYNDVQVISGSLLSDAILSEAGINKADITVSLTNEDKDNILTSILSHSLNVNSNISLLNSKIYDNMLDGLDNNISIDRSTIISSSILKAVKNLDFVHVLSKNYGEVWGLKMQKRADYKKIAKLKGVKIGLVIRDEEYLYELPLNGLQRKDYVILFVENSIIQKAEELFV